MITEIYQKYGGGPTIEKVVNLFYEKVLTDDDLKNYFSTTDIKKLVSHQINFISAVLGGPKDENTDLEKAHKHFKISKVDFLKVVTHLENTLNEMSVEKDDVKLIKETVLTLEDKIVSE